MNRIGRIFGLPVDVDMEAQCVYEGKRRCE